MTNLMPRRIIGVAAALTVLVAGCGSNSAAMDQLTESPSRTAAPAPLSASPTPISTPAVTDAPSPGPSALPLTGEQLQQALLTPADLGKGWKIFKPSKDDAKAAAKSKKQRQDYSPECKDMMAFFFPEQQRANDASQASVKMEKGKDFARIDLTERIIPLPEGGFAEFKTNAVTIIDECPSVSGGGGDELPYSWIITPENLSGVDSNSVAFLFTVNAMILQAYVFWSAVQVGENIVIVSNTWSQKSRKTFATLLRTAIAKVEAASQASASNSPSAIAANP